MKKLLLNSLFIILITSCSKWFKVKSGNGQTYIEDLKSEIMVVSTDDWKVGKRRKQNVSKGFKFKIKIPKIDKKDAKRLYAIGGIDSWIFKISKKERRGFQPIGHILYNIQNFGKVSDSITGHIYYHAAAASSEFRRHECPAFNHRKKISEFKLKKTPVKSYNLFIKKMGSYKTATIDTPSFSPVIFSGGASLKAEYTIELALMNAKAKVLYSKWIKLNNMIQIEREAEISVPSCTGIRTENLFN